jgi:hypothetical protein
MELRAACGSAARRQARENGRRVSSATCELHQLARIYLRDRLIDHSPFDAMCQLIPLR